MTIQKYVKENKIKFKHNRGALTCTHEILGFTQTLDTKSGTDFYGNKYFICETISENGAAIIIKLLEGENVQII